VETVASILADLETLDPGPRPGADALVRLRAGPRVVSYDDWLAIDQAEIGRGQANGKPREKFTRVEEMLAHLAERRR
jgi:ferredoxin--NADP+ reductase